MKKRNKIYIGAGGNIGNSSLIIKEAFQIIKNNIEEAEISSLYITSPQIDESQNDFFNAVISGISELSSLDLLDMLLEIEQQFGRKRDPLRPKGPRTLDLDLLLYGNEIIKNERLVVPHPGIKKRAFVLVPLLELSPDLTCPETGISYSNYLSGVDNQGISCYND